MGVSRHRFGNTQDQVPSDPVAISTEPFEWQVLDFGEACKADSKPWFSGIEGYRTLELVRSIYASCAELGGEDCAVAVGLRISFE